MRFETLALAALLAASALPAHATPLPAGYATLSYAGTVAGVFSPSEGPADIVAGTVVDFTFIFDPSKLKVYPPLYTTDRYGNRVVLHPASISLYNDPYASYTISTMSTDGTHATHTWTLADDIDDPAPNANGIGPFPFVGYDGNASSQLIGFEGDAVNAEGLEFYSAPADTILGYGRFEAHIYGANDDNSDYTVTISALDPTILAIRAQALAAGQIPEPSSWAMLLLGGLCMWRVLRRRVDASRGLSLMPV